MLGSGTNQESYFAEYIVVYEDNLLLNPHNLQPRACMGSWFIRNSGPLGPYNRTMPRAFWCLYGGGRFLMSEASL